MTHYLSRDRTAVLSGLLVPLAVAAILVPWRASWSNTNVALLLVVAVVAVAVLGSRAAGALAAVSAFAWFDFFFTRPYERFSITSREDIETTVLLLLIGAIVTELAAWGRRQHAAAVRRAGYLDGIRTAAEAMASSESPPALIEQVSAQLTRLLSLQSCVFQYGTAGLGSPGRLLHDGRATVRGSSWDADAQGLPPSTELLAESDGTLRGRFLMSPVPGTRPTLEQRLVAGALADQVGAAIGASRPAGR